MKRLESYTENRVVAWAKKRGLAQAKLRTPGQNGFPDRIFFVPGGKAVIWEAKRKGEKPRKLQRYVMNLLKTLDYDVFWSDNAEEAIAYLESKFEPF